MLNPHAQTLLRELTAMDAADEPPASRNALSRSDRQRFGLESIAPPEGIEDHDLLWNALADAIAKSHRGALAYALTQYWLSASNNELDRVLDSYVKLLSETTSQR